MLVPTIKKTDSDFTIIGRINRPYCSLRQALSF